MSYRQGPWAERVIAVVGVAVTVADGAADQAGVIDWPVVRRPQSGGAVLLMRCVDHSSVQVRSDSGARCACGWGMYDTARVPRPALADKGETLSEWDAPVAQTLTILPKAAKPWPPPPNQATLAAPPSQKSLPSTRHLTASSWARTTRRLECTQRPLAPSRVQTRHPPSCGRLCATASSVACHRSSRRSPTARSPQQQVSALSWQASGVEISRRRRPIQRYARSFTWLLKAKPHRCHLRPAWASFTLQRRRSGA